MLIFCDQDIISTFDDLMKRSHLAKTKSLLFTITYVLIKTLGSRKIPC